MNFEVLKKNHLKRNILIAVGVVLILSAVILTFTKAKYRTTQSMPLLQGTINFSPYDFNVVAMYLNQEGAMPAGQTKEVPKFGYTLDTEQSTCIIDDTKDERITMNYVTQTSEEEAYITFNKMSQSGTKCTAYFDLIPDSENPVINYTSLTTNDNSITVIVDASDNIGIYYYYFQLDNEEEIRLEENSYTFEGLIKDSKHTVTVRVEDAAGNLVSETKQISVGYSATDYILASEGGATAVESKGTPDFSIAATTDEGMYAAEDDYGTSYYYRGNVDDNWMQFGTNASGQPLYWRIVRINGDRTLRLIYNGTSTSITGTSTQIQTSRFNSSYNDNMYVGYMYQSGQVHGLESNSTIKGILDTWYQNNLADEAYNIEGSSGFCGDRTPSTSSSTSNGLGGTSNNRTYYGAYIRLEKYKIPSLECPYEDSSGIKQDLYTTSGAGKGNQALTYPIGLITADEVAMAGGVVDLANQNYYLYTGQFYWTMSPNWFNYVTGAYMFYVGNGGNLDDTDARRTDNGVRPVINLRADVQITGSGTTSDPYVVVEN